MAGESDKTYTQEQVDAMIAERLTSETEGLKSNQKRLLDEKKALERKYSAFEGLDPDKTKQALTQLEELERKRAVDEGDFKKLEQQLIERHQGDLKGRDTKIGKLTKALEKRAIRAELQAALIKAGAFKDELELLTDYGERYARLKETDDDFTPYLVQPDGTQMFRDGQGTPMDFGTFAETVVKTKYPRLFEGTGSSGGGATRSTGGASGDASLPSFASTNSPEFLQHVDALARTKRG